jgi:hypothetical protein
VREIEVKTFQQKQNQNQNQKLSNTTKCSDETMPNKCISTLNGTYEQAQKNAQRRKTGKHKILKTCCVDVKLVELPKDIVLQYRLV